MVEGGYPDFIVSLALNKQIQMFLSDDLFKEYKAVFSRPRLKSKLKKSRKYLNAIKRVSIFVKPKREIKKITIDPSDNKLLECTDAAKVHFLVTGNIKHFNFKKFKKTMIVTPKEFMEIIS